MRARIVVDPYAGWLTCAPCAVMAKGNPHAGWTTFQTPSAEFAAKHIREHDAMGHEIDPSERVKLDLWLESSSHGAALARAVEEMG